MTSQQEAWHDREAGQIAHESGSGQTKDDAWFSDLIDEVMTLEDWKKLFRRLVRSKSVRAKAILEKYRFGRTNLNGAPPSRNTFIPLSEVIQLPPIGGDDDEEYDPDGVIDALLPSEAK